MNNYAHIVNGIVENVIVAEQNWINSQNELYVLVEEGNNVNIGQEYLNGFFLPLQPNPSWIRNDDYSWSPPVAYPSDDNSIYRWDEETISWVPIPNLVN